MNDFHDLLNQLLALASRHQQTLAELDEAIHEAENRLANWRRVRQQTLRQFRNVIRQLAERMED